MKTFNLEEIDFNFVVYEKKAVPKLKLIPYKIQLKKAEKVLTN